MCACVLCSSRSLEKVILIFYCSFIVSGCLHNTRKELYFIFCVWQLTGATHTHRSRVKRKKSIIITKSVAASATVCVGSCACVQVFTCYNKSDECIIVCVKRTTNTTTTHRHDNGLISASASLDSVQCTPYTNQHSNNSIDIDQGRAKLEMVAILEDLPKSNQRYIVDRCMYSCNIRMMIVLL